MQEVKYVGLDISTSVIGVCFLDEKEDIVLLDYVDLKKEKSIFKKSDVTKKRLMSYRENYKFKEDCLISIEEAFQSFRKGFSSAKTLSKLNRFNGIVSYLVLSYILL